jgi:hypothetical protein
MSGPDVVGSMHNTFDGTTSHVTTSLFWQRTEDTVGFLNQDNPFDSEIRDIRSLGAVSGGVGDFPVLIMDAYPYLSQGIWGHAPLPPLSDDIEAATRAAARTNPSRAVTSMPAFLGELRDLPGAIFDKGMTVIANSGRKAGKRSKNSTVSFNFAFAPLISDLANMVFFQDRVNERVKELTSLHSKGGLRRKWNLDEDTGWDVGTVPVWTLEAADVNAQYSVKTHRRRWASTRWLPNVPDLALTPDDLREQAKFAVHGWNISLADAWEILPWSWLADYFGNIGDYLLATRNAVQASCVNICIMTHTRTEIFHWIISSSAGLSVSPDSRLYVTKYRAPNIPIGLTLAAYPFLGARQLLTLASIASNYRR